MEKDELKIELSVINQAVEDNTAEINIMLVDQNNNRKQRYRGKMLKTEIEDAKSVIIDSLTLIINEIEKRTLDAYDLDISVDDSTQMVDKSDVIHSDEVLSQITIKYTDDNVVSKNTDLSKIDFMVIQVDVQGKSLYIFKKYTHQSTAYRTSQKYVLSGGLLKPFRDEIITINSSVDAFLLGDTYYVFNRNIFNSIFAYSDVFIKILHANSQMICDSGLLADPAQFVDDCESDGRYLKRLTKVILAKGFDEVAKKTAEVPNIINEFGLTLITSTEGVIIYRVKKIYQKF